MLEHKKEIKMDNLSLGLENLDKMTNLASYKWTEFNDELG